jgi:hypothetical protein
MAAFQQKATDDMYLHVTAKASLLGVDPKTVYPKQVYLSMRIEDVGRAPLLWMNSVATYNAEQQHFEATIDFSKQPDPINGVYELKLVALDPAAVFDDEKEIVWNLGTIDVWYKEGLSLIDHQRKVTDNRYFPKDEIVAQFPPKAEEKKSPVIAMLGVAGIGIVFWLYVSRQLGHCHANIKKLDFWGTLLVVSTFGSRLSQRWMKKF